MTKKHFIRMAEIVRNIRDGHWTDEPPDWAKSLIAYGYDTYPRVRAIQTAEAFIALATEYNPRFDTHRFLVACGLAEPLPKKGW